MEVLNLLAAPITEVIKCFSPSLERRIYYIVRYKRNVDGLKNQHVKLREMKLDVQRSVEAARRKGEVIKAVVEGWLSRVEDFEREVTTLFTEIEEKNGCFQVGFSTFYDLRKGVKIKLDAVNELLIDGEKLSNGVSDPPPPPRGKEIRPIPDFQAFESTKKTMDQIIKYLRDDKINSVGVYGMGGVGKTTLMKEVAKQVLEDGIFSNVVMVTVSQTPVLIKIQGEIAAILGLQLPEEWGTMRAERLLTAFKQEKQILVILDDVWGRLELADVGIPSGDNHKNCKIVITSRIEDVCRNMMDSDAMVQVDILSHGESWLLFQKNAGDLSPSLGTLPQEGAEECGGLPIAIVTLARALRNKSQAAWRDASRQLKKSMMTNIRDMQKLVSSCIRLSYDFIESKNIKLCFLFCCLFPEDYRISVKKLMYYGMGEQIFGEVQMLEDAMDRVHTMVENLVASSLLLRVDDYEDEYSVVMHDVVRDVGIVIASEEENGFLIRAGIGLEEWPEMENLEKCKRMSIIGNKISRLPDQLPCHQLFTLLLSDNAYLEKVPDTFFERMKTVRTLDLSGNRIKSLPSSFSCLTNLQSLHLNFCHLTNVSLIGNLKKLEILCMKNCFLQDFPKEIGGLTNLKLLDLSQNNLQIVPPNLISRLSRLEELYMADNFIEWEIEGEGDESKASLTEVASLSMLTVLHLTAMNAQCFSRCNSSHAEKLKNFEICIGDVRSTFKNGDKRIMCIQLNASDSISNWIKVLLGRTEYLTLKHWNGSNENVTQLDANCFNNLTYLKVLQCHDMKFFMSLRHNNVLVGLQNLEELILEECDGLTDIFNLLELEQRYDKVSKLSRLKLDNLHDLTTVWRVVAPAIIQIFQQLEKLTIFWCDEMVQIISMEEDNNISTGLRQSKSRNFSILPTPIFQNLRILDIDHCESLEHSIGLAQGLLQLEQIFISRCREMKEIIAVENEEIMGKLVLPRLRSLLLHDLPELTHLCQGVVVLECPSLEKIDVNNCSKLKSLSLCMDNLTKLKNIHAEDEWLEGLESDESVKQWLHQLLEKPSAIPTSIHSSAIEKRLENLQSMVVGVWSKDSSLQLDATIQFRKLLAVETSPPINEVIQSGVVPRFVEFLVRDDLPQLQYEAAWALSRIAIGTSENTKVIIDHGAVPIFVKLLGSPREDLRKLAIRALGNVAADSPQIRDLVLGHGALIPLLAQLKEHTKLDMLREASWALSNFCRGEPQPPFEQTKHALPALEHLIHSNDKAILIDACWALCNLSNGTNDKIQAVIEAGVCPRLVELLLHPSSLVLIPVLRTIGNIVSGDDSQTQCIINHPVLPCLLNLLCQNHEKRIKVEVCFVISNIMAGNKEQIQAVIEANIIGPLVHLLQTAKFDIKKETARAISNVTCRGTHDQIKYLVNQGCIKPLCGLLVCPDPSVITICLEGLKNILIAGEAEKHLVNTKGFNPYVQLIDDGEGLDKIKNLQSHDNEKINKMAVSILETYWLEDGEFSLLRE